MTDPKKKVLYRFEEEGDSGFFAIEVEEYGETKANDHYNENTTRSGSNKEDKAFTDAKSTFEKALSPLKAAWRTLDSFMEDAAPDEAEIEMGIKLAGKAGIPFVIMANKDVHFTVKMKWIKGKKGEEKPEV